MLAIIATAVALLTFGWTIGWSIWHHGKTTKPQIRVDAARAVLGTEPIRHVWTITATNAGVVPATLSSASVEMDGATYFFAMFRYVMQSGGELPLVVGPGESWSGMFDADEFAAGLREIAGDKPPPWRVRITVGGPGRTGYQSNWFNYSPSPR